jgi:hypothetical protein
MNILSVSKEKNEAVIRLDSSELVELCNVLYKAQSEEKKQRFYNLYGNMMMVRDLSQYGHVDAFCFERIAECRKKIEQLNEIDNRR